MIRGEEIIGPDIEVAQRLLRSRTVYGRQQLVIDVGLTCVCVAVLIGLTILGNVRAEALALPMVGVLLGLRSLARRYRIRRWCDRHPEIAYALYEPVQPHGGGRN